MKPTYALFLKYQRCEATPEEEKQILDWLEESEENRKRFDQSNFLYCASILNAPRKKARPRILYGWFSIAAALVLLITGGLTLWFQSGRAQFVEAETVVVEASDTSRLKVPLPDGSVVWLNSGSKLSYTADFDRKIILEGEGYFDVVYNPQEPFVVSAGALKVTVLGTVFNLRAYAGEGLVETTLATGRVRLSDKSGRTLTTLSPGQQANCAPDGRRLQVCRVEPWRHLLDTYGAVTIPDVTLSELCRILGSIYDVSVTSDVDDGSIYTFSLVKDVPVGEVIRRLSSLSGKSIDIKNGELL